MVWQSAFPRLSLGPWREEVPILWDGVSNFHVWHDAGGCVIAYLAMRDGEHWIQFPEIASFCFRNRGDEVRGFARPGAQAELIREVYYRLVLPVALQVLGAEVLHASAIKGNAGVIAFCGDSEAGKSTVAYTFGRYGYSLWADDAVGLEIDEQDVRAMHLPFVLRLRPTTASFFGVGTTPLPWEKDDPRDRDSVALTALFLLKRSPIPDTEKTVEAIRLQPTQAFADLLAHAYCFSLDDMERKRRMMQRYLEVAARVPIWEIRFREGLENLPAIVEEIKSAANLPVS